MIICTAQIFKSFCFSETLFLCGCIILRTVELMYEEIWICYKWKKVVMNVSPFSKFYPFSMTQCVSLKELFYYFLSLVCFLFFVCDDGSRDITDICIL